MRLLISILSLLISINIYAQIENAFILEDSDGFVIADNEILEFDSIEFSDASFNFFVRNLTGEQIFLRALSATSPSVANPICSRIPPSLSESEIVTETPNFSRVIFVIIICNYQLLLNHFSNNLGWYMGWKYISPFFYQLRQSSNNI